MLHHRYSLLELLLTCSIIGTISVVALSPVLQNRLKPDASSAAENAQTQIGKGLLEYGGLQHYDKLLRMANGEDAPAPSRPAQLGQSAPTSPTLAEILQTTQQAQMTQPEAATPPLPATPAVDNSAVAKALLPQKQPPAAPTPPQPAPLPNPKSTWEKAQEGDAESLYRVGMEMFAAQTPLAQAPDKAQAEKGVFLVLAAKEQHPKAQFYLAELFKARMAAAPEMSPDQQNYRLWAKHYFEACARNPAAPIRLRNLAIECLQELATLPYPKASPASQALEKQIRDSEERSASGLWTKGYQTGWAEAVEGESPAPAATMPARPNVYCSPVPPLSDSMHEDAFQMGYRQGILAAAKNGALRK